jgi:hypothetical protein
MTRLTITLSEQELERLYQSARGDLRHPREQARFILRGALFGESIPSTDHAATQTTLPTGTTPAHI